jgi:hypothetical protein
MEGILKYSWDWDKFAQKNILFDLFLYECFGKKYCFSAIAMQFDAYNITLLAINWPVVRDLTLDFGLQNKNQLQSKRSRAK